MLKIYRRRLNDYYTTTILSKETDINKLNDLQDDLDREQVYDEQEVEKFFKLYYTKC